MAVHFSFTNMASRCSPILLRLNCRDVIFPARKIDRDGGAFFELKKLD
jgi:hypothetical protein